MKTVREILLNKGYNIYSVSPDDTIFSALKLMAEKKIGALLVIENGSIAGIMSERDYARKVALEGKSSRNATVREIMSDKVIYVDMYRQVEECMALMIEKRIRHLPVFENEKLTGLISIGDVVKAVIDEKEFVISQLVQYIKSTPEIVEEA
ncbi:MAG TPA: CBS domain-containing protein [Ignavibacteriaceae bacterium]|nr:CBS domain-containing protein [Ignavibacteriaceae bacterium]